MFSLHCTWLSDKNGLLRSKTAQKSRCAKPIKKPDAVQGEHQEQNAAQRGIFV